MNYHKSTMSSNVKSVNCNLKYLFTSTAYLLKISSDTLLSFMVCFKISNFDVHVADWLLTFTPGF